jgi:hypothetical protein
MRQYSRVRGERGTGFTYHDMKKVYTIVFFEKSTSPFHEKNLGYFHMGKTRFDTGLKLDLLQEYYLVALDVFRKNGYPKEKSEQTAWIALLATENLEDVERLIGEYPWLKEIYADMAEFLQRPEEVLNMFSEALRILDQNTVQYMVEQQQEEIERGLKEIEQQQEKIEQQQEEIERQKKRAEEAEYRTCISIYREIGCNREEIRQKLMEKYGLSEEAAEQKLLEVQP